MPYPITTLGSRNNPPRGSHRDVYEITENEYRAAEQNGGRIPKDIIERYASEADIIGYGIGYSYVEKDYEYDNKVYPYVGIIEVYNNCE